MSLSLIAATLLVITIFISSYFEFADMILDWWHEADDKVAKACIIFVYTLIALGLIGAVYYAVLRLL